MKPAPAYTTDHPFLKWSFARGSAVTDSSFGQNPWSNSLPLARHGGMIHSEDQEDRTVWLVKWEMSV